MVTIMREDLSVERAQTMKAFGAELILTPKSGGMEYARDLAENMQREGKGRVLDQFANADNPRIHYETTGPELWDQTQGRITHFVSAMGTTGTITGVSRYLKEKNPAIRIIGAQPLQQVARMEDGGEKARLRCAACDWTHWNNPTPVLAAVVEYEGQILLARNAAWPGRRFALITGFMEAGETPQEGIAREIK